MKRIDHFFKICELPKGSQSSADAAEPVAVMEEADSSGSAVVVASNKSNECDSPQFLKALQLAAVSGNIQ